MKIDDRIFYDSVVEHLTASIDEDEETCGILLTRTFNEETGKYVVNQLLGYKDDEMAEHLLMAAANDNLGLSKVLITVGMKLFKEIRHTRDN